jgi:hypothetical protein
MPASTPRLGLPYPVTGDTPDGPTQLKSLATAVDNLGVLGGKRRTAASANITTIESTVVDTQTLALAANSVFQIEFHLAVTVSVAATDLDLKIRLTSVSGTIVGEGQLSCPYISPQPHNKSLIVIYKTTAAELDYFAGTIVRIGGTGNIQAVVPTSITVTNLGPSANVGDF